MNLRPLLSVAFLLLCSSITNSLAQQSPPAAPPAPPAAPAAPAAPAQHAPAPAPHPPDAPEAFSFFFSGDSYLGVYTEEVNAGNMSQYGLSEPRGVGVSRVAEGSPAERAGLRKNDVILRFNGEEVTSARKLSRLISEVAPDHSARVTILRGGSEQELTVTVAKREGLGRNFNFSFPPGQERELLDRAEQFRNQPGFNADSFSFVYGASRRIGVGTTQLTKQLAEYFGIQDGRGVLITNVNENGPAARAGLRAGDVITEVDGARVENISALMRALNRQSQGEVTLTIVRDRQRKTVKLVPESRQAFDFGPEIDEIMPEVGRVVIPGITLPAMPAIRIENMPRINLRDLPNIDLQAVPRIDLRSLPRINGRVLPGIPKIPIVLPILL